MGSRFNADEVFAMAEKIEKNGATFYRKAAEMFSEDAETNKLMNSLAAMEEEHRIIYAAMRSELAEKESESTVFDPDNQVTEYLHAIADKNVFDMDKDPSDILTGNESVSDIIYTAIGLEKDSIIFYLGLKDVIPEKLGRSKIDNIIDEEKHHIVMLSKLLNSRKNA